MNVESEHSPRDSKVGSKMSTSGEKKKKIFDFLRSAIFKILRKITENSINICNCYKFVIPGRSDHGNYWTRASKSSYATESYAYTFRNVKTVT
jgi:hypothetical protein